MQFAYTTILNAPRFGLQTAPTKQERHQLYRHALAMGFDGIEWSPRWFDIHEQSNFAIADLGKEVVSSGLHVSAINLNRIMLSRCHESAANRDRLLHGVQSAGLLGAEAVIVSLSFPQPPSASRAVFVGRTIPDAEFAETADFVKRSAQQAGEYGVRLVLELHDDGLLDTADQCLRMLELVDEPNVSLNPDLGNLIRQQESTETWPVVLARLAPDSGYWHVKNYRDGEPTPIWDGDVDYVEALAFMCRAGYDGWISIESDFGEDVLELQAQSLNWLRKVNSRALT